MVLPFATHFFSYCVSRFHLITFFLIRTRKTLGIPKLGFQFKNSQEKQFGDPITEVQEKQVLLLLRIKKYTNFFNLEPF